MSTPQFVPIAATEAIRQQLEMDMTAFSRALGFSDGGYSSMVSKGRCTKTTALAATALLKNPPIPPADFKRYMLEIVNNEIVRCNPLSGVSRRMLLDGTEYVLIADKTVA